MLSPAGTLIAAGCEYASWEVWDSACNLQVARGTVKPGVRCASVASCKSGRVLYLGCGNLNKTGGYLLMADTFTPSATKKVRARRHARVVTPRPPCVLTSCAASDHGPLCVGLSLRLMATPAK